MDRQDKHDGRYRRSLYPAFRPCNFINSNTITHISYLPTCPVGRVAVYDTTCIVSCCSACSIYGKGDEGKLHEYPQRRLSAYMPCKGITWHYEKAQEAIDFFAEVLCLPENTDSSDEYNRVICN